MKETVVVIVVCSLVLIVYDIYAAIKKGDTSTISYVVLSASKKYPIISFALGVLFGHLFWSQ